MLYDQFVFIITRVVIFVSWTPFFQYTLGKRVWGEGYMIGIVKNSVVVAEKKLHCSNLDGNSNHCSRNFI